MMVEVEASLLEAALNLARRGWAVLPLHGVRDDGRCTCRHADCEHVGKHPRTRHGVKDATRQEGRIRAWFRRWPDSNVGIATGRASGIVVVDVDDGEVLRELEARHGPLPDTVKALTGRGEHYYYRCPAEGVPSVTVEGVEIKGDGTYVVAAPSRHWSGRVYTWEAAGHPDDVALADPPAWLLEAKVTLDGDADPTRDLDPPGGGVIPVRTRNRTLTSIGGAMRADGETEEGMAARLLAIKAARCEEPATFPDSEVREIAASLARYPAGPNGPTVRIPKRLLRSGLGAGAVALYATRQAVEQITGAKALQVTLAAILGVAVRTIKAWAAELRAAGWSDYERPRRAFARVPVAILMDSALSHEAKKTAMHVLALADANGRALVGIAALSKAVGATDRTVKRHLRELRECGQLTTQVARFNAGLGRREKCNVYTFKAAEALAPQRVRPQKVHKVSCGSVKVHEKSRESMPGGNEVPQFPVGGKGGEVAPPTRGEVDPETKAALVRLAVRRGLEVAYLTALVKRHGLGRVQAALGAG